MGVRKLMKCRSDCKWYEPEYTWEVERGAGMYETVGEPPSCKFHGKPYIDVLPDQSPCMGVYEQAELEAMQDDGR